MKNYRSMKNIIISLFIIFLSCKKTSEVNLKTISQQHTSNPKDTTIIEIDNNYKLKINNKVIKESLDFFQTIKNKLINEDIYAQILYDKKNIIINLEIGKNADVYEDIFLSKKEPLIIERIVRTTIVKTNEFPEKTECKKIINKPFLPTSRYIIGEKMKDCKTEKMQ